MKPSYATLEKAIREFIQAFDVRDGNRVPGNTIELGSWPDVRYQFRFAKDYPNLWRAYKALKEPTYD